MSQYASREDFERFGLPAAAISEISTSDIDFFLIAISDRIDTAIANANAPPLAGTLGPPNTFPPAVVMATCALAAPEIITHRGANPTEGLEGVESRADRWQAWLDAIAMGKALLSKTVDATPTEDERAAVVVSSSAKRGW